MRLHEEVLSLTQSISHQRDANWGNTR